MKTKLPAKPDQFQSRLSRIREHFQNGSPMASIPPIVASETEMLLHAYYGSRRKMVVALAKKALWLWFSGVKHCVLLWFSDTIGWTKVYHVTETDEFRAHYQRHGCKCSGSPNCNNMDCIEDSWPKWFRWIMEKIT